MIRDLKSLAVFHAVVQHNGFAKAARELKLTPTGVSQHVSKLEASLNTTLMYRSTRSLSLTEKGKLVADMAAEMMSAVEKGYEQLSDQGVSLSGKLHISIPSFTADHTLLPAIWEFAQRHKSVDFVIDASDTLVDLTRDGFDLAIRFGSLEASAMKARKIGTFNVITFCAAAYLENNTAPETPQQLSKLAYVSLGAKLKQHTFYQGKSKVAFTPSNEQVEINSVEHVLQAVKSGLGYSYLPESVCEEGLKSGELVKLIPNWEIKPFGIYAVRPKDARATDLSAKLVEHLVAYQMQER
ncbi:MAG: LysR family transcriptional regulator [Lentilitoribacter sp.]